MNALTRDYADQVCREIEELPADVDWQKIDETADRLRSMNYQPVLLVDVPDFLTITREKLLQLIQDLLEEKQEDLTEQHLSLLAYHYLLLQRLRRDDPEAWDEVNELMEDD